MFRVVDAKIVTIDVCFNFRNLLELLEHSVSYIKLSVKLREIVEQVSEDWRFLEVTLG